MSTSDNTTPQEPISFAVTLNKVGRTLTTPVHTRLGFLVKGSDLLITAAVYTLLFRPRLIVRDPSWSRNASMAKRYAVWGLMGVISTTPAILFSQGEYQRRSKELKKEAAKVVMESEQA